jgi:integrase
MKRFEKKSGLHRPFRRQHTVLFIEDDLQLLIDEVNDEPFRTMLIAAAFLGLRGSEVAALKWRDFSDDGATLTVRRSIVNGRVSQPKEKCHCTLPVPGKVTETFRTLKANSGFNKDSDWVFADPSHGGAQPYDPEKVLRKHIRPAGARAGIQDVIGWHVFRRSYAAMLVSKGVDIILVSRLMRHRSVLSTEGLAPFSPGQLRTGSERLTSLLFLGPERRASADEAAPKLTAKNTRRNFGKRARQKNAGRVNRKKEARR